MPARFASLIPQLSVRARIIVIALVPVFGLLLNGLVYHLGETDVAEAFASARRAAAVAEASGELKGATSLMMVTAPEFVARPSQQLAETFKNANVQAAVQIGTLQWLGNRSAEDVKLLQASLAQISTNLTRWSPSKTTSATP